MRLWFALSLLAGCPRPSASPLDIGAFARTGGCADLRFFAADEADTRLIEVVTPEVLAGASQPVERAFSVPDVRVTLRTGQHVSDGACDDVIEHDVRVDHTASATRGRAVVTVRPDGERGRADLVLTDVVLDDGTRIDRLTISDVAVGWYPG